MRTRINPILIFVILLSLLACAIYIDRAGTDKNTTKTYLEPLPTVTLLKEKSLFELIQVWREKQGLSRFQENTKLCEVADNRVEEIQDDYSHEKFIIDANANNAYGFHAVSENILAGFSVSEEYALKRWLSSAPHKKAIEGDYMYSCLRCVHSHCVQIFAN